MIHGCCVARTVSETALQAGVQDQSNRTDMSCRALHAVYMSEVMGGYGTSVTKKIMYRETWS